MPCAEHTLALVPEMPLQTGTSHSGPDHEVGSVHVHESCMSQLPRPEQTLTVSVAGMPKHVVWACTRPHQQSAIAIASPS